MLAHLKQGDLQLLAELMEDDEIRSRIDRRYPLDELRDAIDYSESGRARGKIIILP
jgi:NADPH:quinone reductase-like Zn-dependent oxidoreductase